VLSIIVTLLSLLAVMVLIIMLIVPPVVEEIHKLSEIVTSYLQSSQPVNELPHFIDKYVKPYLDIEHLSKYITIDDIRAFLEEKLPQLFSIISGSINAIIGFIASLISLLYLFFILLDYEKLSKGVVRIVPKNHRPFVAGMLQDVELGMRAYFRGQSLIALCVGILFSIGFVIIDFPLAIPLGLFIGFLNLVPYLQIVGFIPTIILAILKAHDTGQSFWMILLLAFIVFVIVQTIQDMYLTPKIMGNVTGLNAAVILLSLSVWGSLLGFIGLIIALPLTTLLISYYKRYILREETPPLTPNNPNP
jgi:predicted PurR-regulated permease PerM